MSAVNNGVEKRGLIIARGICYTYCLFLSKVALVLLGAIKGCCHALWWKEEHSQQATSFLPACLPDAPASS